MESLADRQREVKEQVAKDAIYEAALEVISRNKGENCTMHEIADAAGVATGTLYNYFKNKEVLLYYVHRRLVETILKKMREISEQKAPAPDRLSNLTQQVFRFGEQHHVVFDLAERFKIDDLILPEDKMEEINQATKYIKNVLDEGVEEGVFRQIDTAATARAYFFAMMGAVHIRKYFGEFDSLKNSEELLSSFRDHLGMQDS